MTGRFEAAATIVLMMATSLGLAPSPATAGHPTQTQASRTRPAFDCSKASGQVEKMICADDDLAALDRMLDGVYKAAQAKARDDVPNDLRVEQRGWVKSRDECWKASGAGGPMYLTESWVATDMRSCVDGQYRMRIAELQTRFRLLTPRGPVFYVCNNQPANEFVATFFETDPPAASVERGDRTVTAYQVRTASGAKYEGQNLSLWTKGNEATFTWRGEQLRCTVR